MTSTKCDLTKSVLSTLLASCLTKFTALTFTLLLTHVELQAQTLDLLPLDHSQRLTRIALGSCARQGQPQPIWKAVAESKPDVFIFLGDNIYGDSKDMRVLRKKYSQLAADEGFQRVTQTCPIMATWDDHDYGADDAGAEYPKKAESQQIFLDFFNEPDDSIRRQTPGIYDAKIIGPPGQRVQIILLDTRYFRGPLKLKPRKPGEKRGDRYLPNPDTSVTMLGEVQWRWLEEQLRRPAEVRIVASSIQVITDDHDSEHWSQLPHERQRLFKLIRDTEAAGVLFVSGDVHRGELTTMDGGVGYPLFDLTSSGLNRGYPGWRFDRPNRHRIGTMQWGNNFGMIVLDWDREQPRIRLQIRDEEGDITIQRKIQFSTLQVGVIERGPKHAAKWKTLIEGKTLADWVRKIPTTRHSHRLDDETSDKSAATSDGRNVDRQADIGWNKKTRRVSEYSRLRVGFC